MAEESFIHLEVSFCRSKVFAFLIFLACFAGPKSEWQLKACLADVTWGKEHFGVMEGGLIWFSWILETCDVLGRAASYHLLSILKLLSISGEEQSSCLTHFIWKKQKHFSHTVCTMLHAHICTIQKHCFLKTFVVSHWLIRNTVTSITSTVLCSLHYFYEGCFGAGVSGSCHWGLSFIFFFLW